MYSLNKPNQPLHPPGSEVWAISVTDREWKRETDKERASEWASESLVLPPGGLKNRRKRHKHICVSLWFFLSLKNIWVQKQKNFPSAEQFLARLRFWITVMTFSEKAPWQETMPPLDAVVERLVSGHSIHSVRVKTVRTMDGVWPLIE